MATIRKLTRVTLSRTLTTPSIVLTRDISTYSFKGIVTLKKTAQQDVVSDTTDFCAQVGLDSTGADHAIIASGGHHINPNDKMDTFKRATVQLLDSNGQPMEFQGTDGRKYDRIHVPEDRNLWPQYNNYFTRTK